MQVGPRIAPALTCIMVNLDHYGVAELTCMQDRVTKAVEAIDHWMERFSAIVIGPGLGRDELVHETVKKVSMRLSVLTQVL